MLPAPRLGLQLTHQPLDPPPTDPGTSRAQLRIHPRADVGGPAALVRRHDLDDELLISLRAHCPRTGDPRVVAAPRHAQHRTEHAHRVQRLLRVDEHEPHVLSFAKKAAVGSRRRSNAINDRRAHAVRATIADERQRHGRDVGTMEAWGIAE